MGIVKDYFWIATSSFNLIISVTVLFQGILLLYAAHRAAGAALIFSIKNNAASCAAQLMGQSQKTPKRDQGVQETRPPGSG